MKALVCGLGVWGETWMTMLTREYGFLALVLCDPDEAKRGRYGNFPCYASFDEAIRSERVDFIINVTAPAHHNEINGKAFARGLPVLCEKPIADKYENALAIVELAKKSEVPFMISENYRRLPKIRKLKQILDSGIVGRLEYMHISLFHHHESKSYFRFIDNPFFEDVSIHNVDVIRYLCGSECKTIFAHNFNPPGSIYRGNIACIFHMEMQNGMQASYTGNFYSAPYLNTDHVGVQRIECSRGMIYSTEDRIEVFTENGTATFTDFDDAYTGGPLDDFLLWITEGKRPETTAEDYLNNHRIIHRAIEDDRAAVANQALRSMP